jgi:hypothetical protein
VRSPRRSRAWLWLLLLLLPIAAGIYFGTRPREPLATATWITIHLDAPPAVSASAAPVAPPPASSSAASGAKPAGAPPPSKRTAALTFVDSSRVFPAADVRKAIGRKLGDVHACFAAVERDPTPHEHMEYTAVVNADGVVTAVGPRGSRKRIPQLDACVASVLAGTHIGPPQSANGGSVHMTFDWMAHDGPIR